MKANVWLRRKKKHPVFQSHINETFADMKALPVQLLHNNVVEMGHISLLCGLSD